MMDSVDVESRGLMYLENNAQVVFLFNTIFNDPRFLDNTSVEVNDVPINGVTGNCGIGNYTNESF